MTRSPEFAHTDLSRFWEDSASSYALFPAVRHRWRFLLNSLRQIPFDENSFIFDYGCGTGHLLREAQRLFGLRDEQLGGCDISNVAYELSRASIDSPWIYRGSLPQMDRLCDAIVCSEVIEHAEEYPQILAWLAAHLKPGGLLILTTASGRRCRVDRFVGHLRHFSARELSGMLQDLGLRVTVARHWGFPFYSLQKHLSDFFFDAVRTQFIEGRVNRRRTWIFQLAYPIYFIHDLLPLGPQLFLNARKQLS